MNLAGAGGSYMSSANPDALPNTMPTPGAMEARPMLRSIREQCQRSGRRTLAGHTSTVSGQVARSR